jgi:hypothetical protein
MCKSKELMYVFHVPVNRLALLQLYVIIAHTTYAV